MLQSNRRLLLLQSGKHDLFCGGTWSSPNVKLCLVGIRARCCSDGGREELLKRLSLPIRHGIFIACIIGKAFLIQISVAEWFVHRRLPCVVH